MLKVVVLMSAEMQMNFQLPLEAYKWLASGLLVLYLFKGIQKHFGKHAFLQELHEKIKYYIIHLWEHSKITD